MNILFGTRLCAGPSELSMYLQRMKGGSNDYWSRLYALETDAIWSKFLATITMELKILMAIGM
jgi:hypothetical protein